MSENDGHQHHNTSNNTNILPKFEDAEECKNVNINVKNQNQNQNQNNVSFSFSSNGNNNSFVSPSLSTSIPNKNIKNQNQNQNQNQNSISTSFSPPSLLNQNDHDDQECTSLLEKQNIQKQNIQNKTTTTTDEQISFSFLQELNTSCLNQPNG